MNILAIDPGTTCGWAMWYSGQLSSGVWHLSTPSQRRYEGGGMRYVRLVQYLDSMPPIGLLAYEEVRRHQGVAAAHVYGGIVAHLTAWCERHCVAYCAYPVSQIKRHATGKGNADKAAMLAAAQVKWGGEVLTHDQADALWILDLARRDNP